MLAICSWDGVISPAYCRLMPPLRPQEFGEILAAFGLPRPQSSSPATRGVQNEVWILQFATERLVLKRFRRADPPALRAVVSVMDHVRDVIPVPRLRCHASGEPLLETDVGCFTLSEHADGVQPDRSALTVSDAAAMGAVLGRLHAEPDLTGVPLPGAVSGPSTHEALERIEMLLGLIPANGPADAAASAHLTSRAAWLAGQTDSPMSWQRESRLVHADFTDANVFFAAGQVSAVIDWDQAHRGSPDREFMRAAHFSFGDRADLWSAFHRAYRDSYPLDLADLDRAAEAYAFQRDRGLWEFEEVYLRGNETARQFIQSPTFTPWITRWRRIRVHLA